jgi:AcrR family transcriptional regulator
MDRVVARVKDKSLVERRRAQIVLAARTVFRSKGFHKATVRDIGRAAAVTQGTLYNYVRTKEDILFLICDELVATYRTLVRTVAEQYSDPDRRLRAAIQGLIRIIHEHEDDVLLMYHESHSLPKRALKHVLAQVGEFIKEFAELVNGASRALMIPTKNPQLTANILTFLPAIVALRRWDLRRCTNSTELESELLKFMMQGLGLKAGK